MGFASALNNANDALSRANHALANAMSGSSGDDDTKPSDAAAASGGQAAAAPATKSTESTPAAERPAPQKDVVETAGDPDRDLPTTDNKVNRAMHTVSEGAKTVLELTAQAQAHVQREANKGWGERAADRAGLPQPHSLGQAPATSRHAPSEHGGWRHVRHVAEGPIEIAHVAEQANDVFEVVTGPAHEALEVASKPLTVVSAGIAVSKIVDDVSDSDGISGDSAKPVADLAVIGAGVVAGNNPYVKAFRVGYAVGSILDHYTDASTHIADLAEPAIAQTTQIGFLTDRARENDLSLSYRTRAGTWTERDVQRSRSIVREAREHDLLDEDGEVNTWRLKSLMPNGGDDDAVARVRGGIERAVALQKAAKRS